MTEYVWLVKHTEDWDGGGQTVSIHRSEEGAYIALCELASKYNRKTYYWNIERMELND